MTVGYTVTAAVLVAVLAATLVGVTVLTTIAPWSLGGWKLGGVASLLLAIGLRAGGDAR